MHVLFLAGRELEYSRNDVMLRALRRFAQVRVIGFNQRPKSLITGSLILMLRSLPLLVLGRYDLVFVGFFGHILMLPVGVIARKPILFDAFVSTLDTLSGDRKTFSPQSVGGKTAYWLDRKACQLADHVLLDTPHHTQYFNHAFQVPIEKLSALPVGCNEDLFHPQSGFMRSPDPVTRVLYYSSYMPLHGVENVIWAAGQLQSEPIRFRLIGDGPTYPQVHRLAEELRLENIEFHPSIPLAQLPGEIAMADINLGGHFGLSEKAGRVVPGKVYQVLAMSRPLIATTTPANRDLLRHAQSAYLCPPGDPQALARAILTLHGDPTLRNQLAQGGYALYQAECSEAVITERLRSLVDRLVN